MLTHGAKTGLPLAKCFPGENVPSNGIGRKLSRSRNENSRDENESNNNLERI